MGETPYSEINIIITPLTVNFNRFSEIERIPAAFCHRMRAAGIRPNSPSQTKAYCLRCFPIGATAAFFDLIHYYRNSFAVTIPAFRENNESKILRVALF